MASDEEDFEGQLRNVNVGRSRKRSRSGGENLLRGDALFGASASRRDAFTTPVTEPSTSRTPPAAPHTERLLSVSLGRAERVLAILTDTPRDTPPTTSTPLERYRRATSGVRLTTEFGGQSPIAATAEIKTQIARLKAERKDRERRTQLLIEQQREEAALERARQAEMKAEEELQQQRLAAEEAQNALMEQEIERIERENVMKAKREELLRRGEALTSKIATTTPSRMASAASSALPSRVPSTTPSVRSIAIDRRIDTSVLQIQPLGHAKIPTTSAIEETYRTAAPATGNMSNELFNKAMKRLDAAISSSTGHVFKGSGDTQVYTDWVYALDELLMQAGLIKEKDLTEVQQMRLVYRIAATCLNQKNRIVMEFWRVMRQDVATIHELKEAVANRFLPTDYLRKQWERWDVMVQGSRRFTTFYWEAISTARLLNITSPEILFNKLKRGANADIRNQFYTKVVKCDPTDYQRLAKILILADDVLRDMAIDKTQSKAKEETQATKSSFKPTSVAVTTTTITSSKPSTTAAMSGDQWRAKLDEFLKKWRVPKEQWDKMSAEQRAEHFHKRQTAFTSAGFPPREKAAAVKGVGTGNATVGNQEGKSGTGAPASGQLSTDSQSAQIKAVKLTGNGNELHLTPSGFLKP